MTAKDLIQSQFGLIYQVVSANTEGLSHADSLRQPDPGGNCANWILGHLTHVQNSAMQLLGEAPVWESEQLTRAGEDPITRAEGAIDWDTMRSAFLASKDRCLAAIARQSDAELMQGGIPHPFGGETTRQELLALLAFHQAYHAGQLAISRRVAGYPGAVRAPGQN
ncbi:MAG: DinB family protein [Gemmatimonadota bacterium]